MLLLDKFIILIPPSLRYTISNPCFGMCSQLALPPWMEAFQQATGETDDDTIVRALKYIPSRCWWADSIAEQRDLHSLSNIRLKAHHKGYSRFGKKDVLQDIMSTFNPEPVSELPDSYITSAARLNVHQLNLSVAALSQTIPFYYWVRLVLGGDSTSATKLSKSCKRLVKATDLGTVSPVG